MDVQRRSRPPRHSVERSQREGHGSLADEPGRCGVPLHQRGGLFGILSSGQLWSTAHVATNDESEFTYGQGVLASTLEDSRPAGDMNERVDAALAALDLRFEDAAARFEEDVVYVMDHFVTAYVTSFLQGAVRKGLSRRPSEPVAGLRRLGRVRDRVQQEQARGMDRPVWPGGVRLRPARRLLRARQSRAAKVGEPRRRCVCHVRRIRRALG